MREPTIGCWLLVVGKIEKANGARRTTNDEICRALLGWTGEDARPHTVCGKRQL